MTTVMKNKIVQLNIERKPLREEIENLTIELVSSGREWHIYIEEVPIRLDDDTLDLEWLTNEMNGYGCDVDVEFLEYDEENGYQYEIVNHDKVFGHFTYKDWVEIFHCAKDLLKVFKQDVKQTFVEHDFDENVFKIDLNVGFTWLKEKIQKGKNISISFDEIPFVRQAYLRINGLDTSSFEDSMLCDIITTLVFIFLEMTYEEEFSWEFTNTKFSTLFSFDDDTFMDACREVVEMFEEKMYIKNEEDDEDFEDEE